MKILLADDHPMVRVGLKLTLTRLYEDAMVSEARDYAEAIHSCTENNDFDLVLLDKTMPGENSIEALNKIKRLLPHTPIVILSASEEPKHVWECLQHGARGYIPKTMSEEVMDNAIQLILSGGTYIPDTLLNNTGLEHSVTAVTKLEKQAVANRASTGRNVLTNRQAEILSIMRLGKSNKQIAAMLQISTATVQTHVNAIFKILEVNNRTEAVHVASDAGLFHNP